MAVRILDRHLEGTQVISRMACSLDQVATMEVRLPSLIVQGEVLHVSVDAVFLSALDGVGSHDAGQDAVPQSNTRSYGQRMQCGGCS